MSAYVMYGFDTAGTLAEETHDPRRAAPPAIIRALLAAAVLGALLILFALMAVKNIHDAANGLPLHHQAGAWQHDRQRVPRRLGAGDPGVLRWRSRPPASECCSRWRETGGCPVGNSLARVSGRAKVPIIPALFVGVCSLALLAVNIANQSAFTTLTSVAIIMFYLPYLAVTGSMLSRATARVSGRGPSTARTSAWAVGASSST